MIDTNRVPQESKRAEAGRRASRWHEDQEAYGAPSWLANGGWEIDSTVSDYTKAR